MKFSGELKFPEIDHPGVPIQFVIEGTQTELVIEGESLGRWSLYDVHARRLVSNAFLIDLDGTEVTFVADDPIDFAYRGVEHMAETWATLKAKRMASRSIAVRKSRKGVIPSRIDDMKTAMEANLEAQATPRQLAGELVSGNAVSGVPETATDDSPQTGSDEGGDSAVIPLVGEETPDSPLWATLSEEARLLEEEKERIAEDRAHLESERRAAEQREADRIEAFRLEMQRLEDERAEVRLQAEEVAQQAIAASEEDEEVVEPAPEPERIVIERELLAPDPEHWRGQIAPDLEAESPMLEPDRQPEFGPEPVVEEPEPELDRVMEEPEPEPHPVAEEPEPEPEPDPVAEEPLEEESGSSVVDLKAFEDGRERILSLDSDIPPAKSAPMTRGVDPTPPPQPEPALAGAAKDKTGLMGAVKAAFRSGPKDHDHQFIEAPGGIGITRYVCEECGYVSISG